MSLAVIGGICGKPPAPVLPSADSSDANDSSSLVYCAVCTSAPGGGLRTKLKPRFSSGMSGRS